MKVEKALILAGGVITFSLILAVISLRIAVWLEDTGGFLADVGAGLGAMNSLIFVCTSVAMMTRVYLRFARQPDQVPRDRDRCNPVYREQMYGSVLYTNTAAISGDVATMTVHGPGQAAPEVKYESRVIPAGRWDPGSGLPDRFEVLNSSLESVYRENRGDGK